MRNEIRELNNSYHKNWQTLTASTSTFINNTCVWFLVFKAQISDVTKNDYLN